MFDRKKHQCVSVGAVASTAGSVSIGYAFWSSLVLGTVLLVAATTGSLSTTPERARVAVSWSVARGDYVYRLRGRYSISSVTDNFTTSIANGQSPAATVSEISEIEVPAGLYRVTLESGYSLERSGEASAGEASAESSVEVVPAALLSQNPVLVSAEEGGVARLGLSLVDMPGTAAEPESTCMNGS
jgi:hypothetical protein